MGDIWRRGDHRMGQAAARLEAVAVVEVRRSWRGRAARTAATRRRDRTPQHECLAVMLRLELGVPVDWLPAWMWRLYNGRDVHGEIIDNGYQDGHFPHLPVDPSDPPRFESQANYLRRLGLFLAGEQARPRAADFERETIVEILGVDFDDDA